ncbi:DUF3298 and DUF4163 domain-containing protein [Microbulbifer litoralis]|uniref:DUF3298 and DUF4163 domain-containing protein n=1 Tax=Microbulbifer litoralis TaxID=2933965 RepID=UPI0020278619|nr:DUF3298 and DUF4163 domain-containing protein [Microbulbifer sp. GX H0434]
MLTAVLFTSGCGSRSDSAAPQTLKPRQESFERQAAGCDKEDECATVSVTYQLFENRPALNDAIRRQLIQQMQGVGESGSDADSIAAAAEAFLKQARELPDDTGNRWMVQANGKLLGRSGNLVAVEISSYAYTGGAHGMPATSWLNWDLDADAPVTLEQLIQPGQEDAFWELARRAHQRWLREQTDIDEEFRQLWPFAKTGDFRLDDTGLTLLYGVYTLGPYAMGQVELKIPREQLDGVIRQQYLVDRSQS